MDNLSQLRCKCTFCSWFWKLYTFSVAPLVFVFITIDHFHSTCTFFTVNTDISSFPFPSKLSNINSTGTTPNVSSLPLRTWTCSDLYDLLVWFICMMYLYDLVLPSLSNAFTTSSFLPLLSIIGIILIATSESLFETVDNICSPDPFPCFIWFDLGPSCSLAPSWFHFVGSSFFWKCYNLWWSLSQSCTPHFLLFLQTLE